jgi:hypothetical protein
MITVKFQMIVVQLFVNNAIIHVKNVMGWITCLALYVILIIKDLQIFHPIILALVL